MLGAVFQPLTHSLRTLSSVARDLVHLLVLVSRSRRALAAENLFLRKQLALFQERKAKPHRADDSTRLLMVILGRRFAWRDALVNVRPDTFVRWHRQGFRLLWRWKSRPVGRPRIPKDLRRLIQELAAENPTWGEQRIANELHRKLTIRISPRTVGKYLRRQSPVRTPDPQQRWLSFVRHHAKVMVAGDFFVVFTATFRTLYVFLVVEIGSRQILHHHATAHPTAEWTLQQSREALPGGHPYRFVIHDRDYIFSESVDQGLANLGVRVLPTPVRAPKANSVCEPLGGSVRRECLDFLIPFHQRHLQMTIRDGTMPFNRGRPHSALGPGLPEPLSDQVPSHQHRHRLPIGYQVVKRSVLGGLHHEYGLKKEAA